MFKRPFSFTGRIRRTEYGISAIIYFFAVVAVEYISLEITSIIFFLMAIVPIYWFMLAQGAKRCHDRGHSGWYQLIPFYSLWLLFGVGQFGENEYGSDPKDISTQQPNEIDAYAYRNFVESKESVGSSLEVNDEIIANLHTIKKYIAEEKRSVIGSNKREALLELIGGICQTKEKAQMLLDLYQSHFNKDLIEDLKKLNSSYNAIQENVQSFIEAGIIASKYPHNRI